ncbi:MAG: ring-cleaving dioxygenase [Methylobacteriaceae bacterium]|nr:ring-cleaving dioxygenase [Methylobacteriaceae bacterium]
MQLTGLHHVTAVTADAPGNLRFYTQVLGLRLVKKTVNQDDVSAYHLYYADALASPGSDLTFFDWPVRPERRGNRTVTRTGLRVAGEAALGWWADHLAARGVQHGGIAERDGRLVLDFEDPEGQRLTLVDDRGEGEAHPWDRSPIPTERQVRGLGPVELTVPNLAPTVEILEKLMGMRRERGYALPDGPVEVYAMGQGGPAAELHLAERPRLAPAGPGAGGVHHVAFRTPDKASYRAWADRLAALRVPNSGPVNRFYFESLYFREPNGILFEIATDGPGFATDEPLDSLGESLALPAFLEAQRAEIEAGLKPL